MRAGGGPEYESAWSKKVGGSPRQNGQRPRDKRRQWPKGSLMMITIAPIGQVASWEQS